MNSLFYKKVNIRFCEGKYYSESNIEGIFEFYNSLSSLFLIIIGLYTLKYFTKYKYAHFSLFLNGIGSFLYHSKFLFIYKLIDEMSMMFCVCYCCSKVYTCIYNKNTLLINILLTFMFFYSFYMNIIDSEGYIFRELFSVLFIILGLFLYILHYQLLLFKPYLSRNILSGLLTLIFGCGFWAIDELYCNKYIFWFHSIWHILISIGSFILFSTLEYI